MRPNVRPDADDPGLGGTVRPEVAAQIQTVLRDHMPVQYSDYWECDGPCNLRRFETFADWSAHIGELLAALEAVPPPTELDEAALDAAERAYWSDDGVSRSNLAAAIRAYQAVAQRAPSDAAVEVLLATLQPFIIDRPPIGLPTELAYDALARAYTIDFGGRGASPTGVSGAAESQAK